MHDRRAKHVESLAFEKLRKIAPNQLAARRERLEGCRESLPSPDELAFKLTNRCDLRCTHCYQWGERGYHHRLRGQSDLDIAIVQKALAATAHRKSNIYLWGGEPLIYRHWDALVQLLIDDSRWISICTNGTFIGKRLPSLERLSDQLEVSVSLDGFANEHEALRGAKSFERATEGIRLLVSSRKAGTFRGEVTVNFVMSTPMLGRASAFVRYLAQLGVQTVYVSLPWFISRETAGRMDDYFQQHFDWQTIDDTASWNSYDFAISSENVDRIIKDIDELNALDVPIKIRYNPRLASDELVAFLKGSHVPAQGKTYCESIHARMDIFPDGSVVSCKFFPEMVMGNLEQSSVESVWHGGRYAAIRQVTNNCGLMPVCAKCNLLYARGS